MAEMVIASLDSVATRTGLSVRYPGRPEYSKIVVGSRSFRKNST